MCVCVCCKCEVGRIFSQWCCAGGDGTKLYMTTREGRERDIIYAYGVCETYDEAWNCGLDSNEMSWLNRCKRNDHPPGAWLLANPMYRNFKYHV